MRILVTGASGQLGRALREALARPPEQHKVVAVDRAALDITDFIAVSRAVERHAPDLVINAAAYTDVDGAESDPQSAYRANALGPRNLAVASAAAGAALLQVSTDYVFDGAKAEPYHEYDVTAPRSIYGASKLAGEEAVRAANPRHYIVRTAWLYAPWGRNFPSTMLALAREKPQVRVVDDQRGSPTYAPHLAHAIARLIETRAWGTYHLAGSGAATWCELARELYAVCGVATAVVPVTTKEFPRPAPRPANSVLVTIQSPRIVLPPWEEGLRELARAAECAQRSRR